MTFITKELFDIVTPPASQAYDFLLPAMRMIICASLSSITYFKFLSTAIYTSQHFNASSAVPHFSRRVAG